MANLGGPGQPIQTPGGIGRPATNEPAMGNIGTGQPIYNPIPNNNPGAGISPQSPYVNESFVSSSGPGYQYQGDSPFGNIFNDFYGSGAGTGPQTMDMTYNPFTGQHGSSSLRSEMHDFISGAYGNMQNQMTNKMKKSQEFMDKFNMYGDAMNTYNNYQGGQEDYQIQNPLQPGMPGGIANLPPPIMQPGGGQPVDGSGVGIGNMVMPQPGTPGYDLINGGTAPLPGMPTPNNPTGTTGSSHSHNDLIQGIGNLLQQYMPNAAANAQKTLGQTTPTINNQPFPSMTNNNQGLFGTGVANSFSNNFNNATQPQQVFGNMITPMGRQN